MKQIELRPKYPDVELPDTIGLIEVKKDDGTIEYQLRRGEAYARKCGNCKEVKTVESFLGSGITCHYCDNASFTRGFNITTEKKENYRLALKSIVQSHFPYYRRQHSVIEREAA
ncbi:hypothetical protein [Bacillus cereus]|uniref:Uncharacterized protein n=1 Tax=Bacillus cereus TaxID=1396 RepID=A0AA44QBF0_BACCE|nr:hypothetical protein [Bacillus cereus]PFN08270.1 hypothetical protein COJ55_07025 [Bacillus cereus]PFS02700.1 hypothetical protein COK38_09050 [Bacillus cereus]